MEGRDAALHEHVVISRIAYNRPDGFSGLLIIASTHGITYVELLDFCRKRPGCILVLWIKSSWFRGMVHLQRFCAADKELRLSKSNIRYQIDIASRINAPLMRVFRR